mmetsp:Transcript_3991/g.14672  ORF Transcript_3991/g.14672 Transcript_3991/m.14672 type:complete len:279 (+) Transcript_3991:1711-2547(+)
MTYFAATATARDARITYSNPNKSNTLGPLFKVCATAYPRNDESSATKTTTREHTLKCARRVVLGLCSMNSTRSPASQWKIFTKSRDTNSTTNFTLNSSLKMVIARQVSIIASLLRSYRRSISASRSCPRNTAFSTCPKQSVIANARLPSTTTESFDVLRYNIAGKYCSRVFNAWYTKPPATAKDSTTYRARELISGTGCFDTTTHCSGTLKCDELEGSLTNRTTCCLCARRGESLNVPATHPSLRRICASSCPSVRLSVCSSPRHTSCRATQHRVPAQ